MVRTLLKLTTGFHADRRSRGIRGEHQYRCPFPAPFNVGKSLITPCV
jgi:hypothetical protein